MIVGMNNVVENLKNRGLSYDTIGAVCGETYTNVCNYAVDAGTLPESAIDKLKRLDAALESTGRENVGSLFEMHILLSPVEEGNTAWLYLYEMWANGVVSDEELVAIIAGIDKGYLMVDLVVDFTGGPEHALEEISNLRHAEPSDYLGFRKLLPSLVGA